LTEKVEVKNVSSTKIDLNHNKIGRIHGLDELAGVLFPGNNNHQKIFLAIFIELKYAPQQFMILLHACSRLSAARCAAWASLTTFPDSTKLMATAKAGFFPTAFPVL